MVDDECPEGVICLEEKEGEMMFDRQVRKYFGISGNEFIRRYQTDDLGEFDHSDVLRISMLLPFSGMYRVRSS